MRFVALLLLLGLPASGQGQAATEPTVGAGESLDPAWARRSGRWSAAGRTRYGLAVVALAALAWQLAQWNLGGMLG